MTAGCVTPARHQGVQQVPLPELIPRDQFFEHENNLRGFLISPDGGQLAWLGDHKGNMTIFFKSIGTETAIPVNTHSWCHVTWYTWAPDSRHLIYSLGVGPNRAQHLYQADTLRPNQKPVDLTPDAKQIAFFEEEIFSDPENILLSQDKEIAKSYDLYKVNLKSGAHQLLGRSGAAVLDWIVDRKGNLRGRIRADEEKKWHLEQYDPLLKSWEKLATWTPDESIVSRGMTPDDRGFWLLSNKNRDRIALVRFDIETRTESVVCEDPEADIEEVYISRITGKAMFCYSYPDYPETLATDPALQADLDRFKGKERAGIQVLGMDDTENLWTVKVYDETKELFYQYDRATKKKKFLGSSRWAADLKNLAKTRPVSIISRDGMKLKGFLTRPEGGSIPLPMVLLVHGGPWARDYWQADREVQFLVNRGYVVLQVNYRGSTGYGRAYKEAARNEFGRKMHDDLIDAVNWAIDQKIADSEKIAIVGGSYGGYAAMAGLTFTPDVFTCAIAINGVSSLADFIGGFPDNIPLYQKRGFQVWHDYVGDPEDPAEKEDMERRSPLFFTERVKKPLLVILGEQDGIVSPNQSIMMIDALRRDNKNVIYKRFENEGHSINWIHNSARMYQEIESFLARYLGGRAQG